MNRNESQTQNRRASGTFNQVFDEDSRRVCGLWIRNGVFCAQVRFSPQQTGKLPLNDAKTLPQAKAARQVLKQKIKNGEIKAPGTAPIHQKAQSQVPV
jgi:hypothetical protein